MTPEEREDTIRVLKENPDATRAEQAEELGLHLRSLQKRIDKYFPEFKRPIGSTKKQRTAREPQTGPEFPRWVDDDISVDEIREHLKKRVAKKLARDQQENWFPIKLPDDRPFMLCWVGDPHLGEHANWPLLDEHVALWSKYAGPKGGIYCVNAGDTIDNWPLTGRLAKLWAERDISQSTEWKLVRWFFHDAGIEWLVWIMGNHDMFNTNSVAMFKEISRNLVPVMGDEAKFVLITPNKRVFPVHARHEFKGHSQFNPLHALDRYMSERSDVDRGVHVLGVEGHRHNWAIHEKENPDRGYFLTTGRARGYKISDGYAKRLGFNEQEFGASLSWVCNPQPSSLASQCQMFRDVAAGNDYLQFLRRKHK